jgi:glycosyltransferase involved in cell wall biosynthesis
MAGEPQPAGVPVPAVSVGDAQPAGEPVPAVSVVVSTYNRPARLAALLAALREQALARDRFEVIVVDNGSGPETGRLLEDEMDRRDLWLHVVRHPVTRGPAGGRNSGWRLARAPVVAFTDDDCRPERDWLSAIVQAAGRHPAAIIQGRTVPDPEDPRSVELFSHTITVDRLGPQYETCNIAYPRALLQALGGFDESFGLRPAGEDTDLAWRAIERGAEAVLAAEAVVRHAVEPVGARGRLRIASRWGPAVRVLAEHPGARELMLYRGCFWNVWHYLVWRSLLSALGPGWLRRMLIARHLMTLHRRAVDGRASSAAIPYLLVHDVVECWAVARGALRHRTLVL